MLKFLKSCFKVNAYEGLRALTPSEVGKYSKPVSNERMILFRSTINERLITGCESFREYYFYSKDVKESELDLLKKEYEQAGWDTEISGQILKISKKLDLMA